MINSATVTIETVVVTANDEVLDSVSFAGKGQAEAYKRGVRNWAAERGVIVRVWSQTMSVEDKPRGTLCELAVAC